jgi:hypothetical protein
MGNIFSVAQEEEPIKCVLCENTIKNATRNYSNYFSIECSKCKKRIQGHIHLECMNEYVAVAEKNGGFICPHCRPNTVQDKQS